MAIGIHCCKDCVAPKRHPGCHATCKEYIEEKAKYEEQKAKIKEAKENQPYVSIHDFDQILYAGCKRRKPKKY